MRRWELGAKMAMFASVVALGACGTSAASNGLDGGGSTDDAQLGDAAPADATADTLVGDTIGADGVVDVADVIGADAVADVAADVANDVATDAADTALDAAIWDVPGPDAGPDVAAPACTDFAQPASTSPTSITLVNQTAGNVYLGLPTPNCAFNLGYTSTLLR